MMCEKSKIPGSARHTADLVHTQMYVVSFLKSQNTKDNAVDAKAVPIDRLDR